MILAIDIGNTNIVLGGYEEDGLTFSTRMCTDRHLEADQYALQISGILDLYGVQAAHLTGAILSSVVPQLTGTVSRAVESFAHIEPLRFSRQLPIGVNVAIDRPEELGADLLAGAAGAVAGYALPAVVIDMGTATKLTAIDVAGTVQGVSIMPGVFLSLDALTSGASQLGGIAVEAPQRAIGKNTVESMQSGVVFGTAAMLDGMLNRFEQEMGPIATVLATGGAAGGIVPYCCHAVKHVPTLILDGLYAAWRNVQASQN